MKMLYFVMALLTFSAISAKAQEVGNITPEDQRSVSTRIESLNSTSFSFGPSWANDTNNSNMYYAFQLGRNFEATETAEIRINLNGAFAGEGSGNWWSGMLGAGWLPLKTNISPVIGAEVGYGYAHIKDADDASGFAVGGFAGVRFFRTSTTQLSLEGFFQSILAESDPTLSGVRVGILF